MASAQLPTTALRPSVIKYRTDRAVAKRFNIRFKIDRMREQRRLERELREVWDE